MRACSSPSEIVLLVDGELTENRADAVRGHLQECAACQRELETVRALVHDVARPLAPRPLALERVVARFDEAPRRARGLPRAKIGAALAAAVAVAAIGVRGFHPDRTGATGTWTARGVTAAPSLARLAGVTVYRGTSHLEPLRDGDEVTADTAYAVGYRNLGPDAMAFAMVLAVDARGEVHWIAPAWLDERTDPPSEAMAHADREPAPSAAIILDRPALGAMRVLTVMTPRPVHVSEIEHTASGRVDGAALRGLLPGAVVEEAVVRVVGAEPGSQR